MNNIFLILILIFASTKIKGKNICLCIYGLIGILVLSQFYDGYCNYIQPDPIQYTIVPEDTGTPCSGLTDDSSACDARNDCVYNNSVCGPITPDSTFYDLDKLARAYSCTNGTSTVPEVRPIDVGASYDAAGLYETISGVAASSVDYCTSPTVDGSTGGSPHVFILPECAVAQEVSTRTCGDTDGSGADFDCSTVENSLNPTATCAEECTVEECCTVVTGGTLTCANSDGSGTEFDCSGETNNLNPDATCAGATCTPDECCTVEPGGGGTTRTCADINGDGTADDPYNCAADSSTSNTIDPSPGGITCAGAECTAAECCTVVPSQTSTGNQTCQQFISEGNNSQNYCRRYPNAAHSGQTAGWKYQLPFQLLTEEPHHADLLDISYEIDESNVCTSETCFGGNTNVNACTNPQSDQCKDFKHDQEMCCKEKMPCYIHFMNNPQGCPSGYEAKPDITGFDRTNNSLRDTAPVGSTPEVSLQMYENIASKNNYGRSNHLCDGDVCDTETTSSPDTPVCCMKTFNCRDDVLLANELHKHLDGFDETPYLSLAFFDDVESIDDMCTDRNGFPASSENEAWENVQQRLLNIRNIIPGKPNDDGIVSQPINVSSKTISKDLCSFGSAWYFNEGSTDVGKCCTVGIGSGLGLCSPSLKIQPSGQ